MNYTMFQWNTKRSWITRDDLAVIGVGTIMSFVWYFFHWLLS